MKKLLVSAVALAAFSGSALAADLYTPAPVMYDWNGGYLGGHAGYLWGTLDYGYSAEDCATLQLPQDLCSGGLDVDGFVGGVVGGWNFQSGQWVFGVEGDFGWSGADGAATFAGEDDVTPIIGNAEINWNAHVRGRVGVTLGETGNTLLFVAGGLAVADIDASGGVESDIVTVGGTYTGWTIGGGVDHAFSENLVGGLEVLYDDYGSKTYEVDVPGGPTVGVGSSLDALTVRGRLIYHFN